MISVVRALCVMFLAVALAQAAAAQSLIIGSKDFTEQRLVAEITAQFLRAKGLEVDVRTGLSTPGLRTEQEAGLVDLYWEYTGTSLAVFNGVTGALGPEDGYARARELDAKRGLVWLSPSKINNTYALAMRRADAVLLGIARISDLARESRSGKRFRIAVNTEFFIRPDGLQPLQQAYRFEFGLGDIVRTAADDIYDRLRQDRSIDVGLVFSTDGRNGAYDFAVLDDDRKFFPAYVLAPVVRSVTLETRPELAADLARLSGRLDNAAITRLNAEVDLGKKPLEEVAAEFLKANGL